MRNFMIHPQLFGSPVDAVYQTLHALMERKEFFLHVGVDQMPHATYYGTSEKTANQLSAEIKEMIKRELNYDSRVAVGEVVALSIDGHTATTFGEQLAQFAVENPYPALRYLASLAKHQ